MKLQNQNPTWKLIRKYVRLGCVAHKGDKTKIQPKQKFRFESTSPDEQAVKAGCGKPEGGVTDTLPSCVLGLV